MELLNENDVKILDLILNISLKNGAAYLEDLPALSEKYLANSIAVKASEYENYFDILQRRELAKVEKQLSGIQIKPIPQKTKNFINQGGFTAEYNDQRLILNRNKEIEEINFKKLKWDSQVSRFQAKTKWWPLIISGLSLFISLYALLKDNKQPSTDRIGNHKQNKKVQVDSMQNRTIKN